MFIKNAPLSLHLTCPGFVSIRKKSLSTACDAEQAALDHLKNGFKQRVLRAFLHIINKILVLSSLQPALSRVMR